MSETKRFPYVIEVITLIGVAVYIAKSLYFAHSALSIGDEGAYLFKGLMFARGDYRPFQEYGFWTNKAPLAFLIPGYPQYWFDAGLREARYVAIAVSVLALTGLWITANRLGGKSWAAIAVWVFTLSDAHVATYSQALSQGLVACMMSWMFVCTLGGNRLLWQLILGSVISVMIVMTRQNMIIVPPILILYIFWQFGLRAGWWAFSAGLTVFVVFLSLYWPHIIQLWASWLPQIQLSFLEDTRVVAASVSTFEGVGLLSQWQAFAIGIRDHFFILCGSVSGAILWAQRGKWKNPTQFKEAVFVGMLFLSLFLLHMWGSLFNDFCALCFTSYQMFFSMTGFFFVLLVFSNGISDSKFRLPLLAISLVLFSACLGLYYFPLWGDWLLDTIRLPRIGPIVTENKLKFASLRDTLTYAFQMKTDLQKRVAAAAGGALAGAALLILTLGFLRRFIATRNLASYPASRALLAVFLFTGVTLPAALSHGEYQAACSTNFLTYYEQAGKRLDNIIPPQSLVYWKGSGRHLALLLYAEDIRYFPPQISAGAGYFAGDSNHLLRFGMYNVELDGQWRESADIFIIWRHFPTIEFEDFLDQTKYEAIPFDMGELRDCEDPLYIFKRRQ